MTIAQRMIALIATSIVCLVLLSSVSYYQMDKVYKQANYGNTNVVPSIEKLSGAAITFFRSRGQVFSHVINTEQEAYAGIEKSISESFAEIDKQLKDYEAIISSSEDKRLLEDEKAILNEYRKTVDPILKMSRDFYKEKAFQEIQAAWPIGEKLTRAFATHTAFNEKSGAQKGAEAVVTKDSATWITIAVLLGALAALLIIGFTTLRSLTKRLAQANQAARQISSGDLTSSDKLVLASSDEIGQFLRSMDKMRRDLAQTVGDIVTNAENVANSAQQLSASAKQVSNSTENQTSSTAAAAAAVEEMTVSIEHIGASAEEASQQATAAGEMAADSEKTVGTASTRITQVADQVEHTANQMQILSEQVQQIGSITVVIRDVADQTNLLALNAAIEAARAGQQGRGFAVVADEVRKLAERTTASVQKISSVISTIQEGATAVVSSMQSSQKVVAEVVVAAENASKSMGEICTSTNMMQQSIESISNALREQKTSSADLARNVESIARMSDDNSVAVDSVAETVQQLVEFSDNLKSSVSRFRL